jgi:hypothetical protein
MKQNENKTNRQIFGTDADIELANRINDCIKHQNENVARIKHLEKTMDSVATVFDKIASVFDAKTKIHSYFRMKIWLLTGFAGTSCILSVAAILIVLLK